MPQQDNISLTHSPAYTASIAMSGLSALLSALEGQFVLSALLAGFTTLLILSRLGKVFSPKITQTLNQFERANNTLESAETSTPRHLSAILTIITLGILFIAPEQGGIWIYSLPLMLMFFFDFKIAVPILSVTSLLSILLISWQGSPLIVVQTIPNFVLFLGASCALVYLRELRRRQLKPLRRTDNLSDAASRQHLDDDLQKEVQRSEREGTELSVIAMQVDDAATTKFENKDHDLAQIEIGKLLHNNLRLFDSYYRLEQHRFLIMLPHTSSKQALKIADTLRIKIKNDVLMAEPVVTTSMGISHLNVGDDSQSLMQHALFAQDKASNRGGDQAYLFSDRDFEEKQNKGASDED